MFTELEAWRRDQKWSARDIHHHLVSEGHRVCLRTVSRWRHRARISRLWDLTPAGEDLRQQPAQRISARGPGHMVHLDMKKIGRIPDRGGRRTHGRNTLAGRAAKRGAGRRVEYTYLHSVIDGHTRLAYTEALEDERAVTMIVFVCRARAFFAAYGIRIDRVITDNGNNYRAADFARKSGLVRGPAPLDPRVHPQAQREG